ncbi:hypothetical protein ATY27_01155 [Rheinheimera sp. F8]|nr:hypothetical protein ATY27_01155 [Rheinheimera sp. F8]
MATNGDLTGTSGDTEKSGSTAISFDLYQHSDRKDRPHCNLNRFVTAEDVMPKSLIPELRGQLQQELQQLRQDIFAYLQRDHAGEFDHLLLQLEHQALSHWPELLQHWLTPELEQKTRRLELVQAALSQMDMGLYGLCSDCEARIERELLQQDPARQRCARCERQQYDSKNRLTS